MVREFSIIVQSSCRSLRARPKPCKKCGVVAEFFLLKVLEGVLRQTVTVTSYVIDAYLCLAMLHAWTMEYQHMMLCV